MKSLLDNTMTGWEKHQVTHGLSGGIKEVWQVEQSK